MEHVLPTSRALILARGLGTRMRKAEEGTALDAEQAKVADAGMKGMIPIGRPFLDYVISALADAGVSEVCLVIGPEHGAVREHYTSLAYSRVRVTFAIQEQPLGTADAVKAGERFADGSTFLVLNADNYYPVPSYRTLAQLGASGLVGFERDALVRASNIPQDRIRRFALVQTDADGFLTEIVEKPDDDTYARLAATSLVSMNLWSFSPVIFQACRRVQPSVRGELELQDAVRIAMHDLGERFKVIPYAGGVLDLSSRKDIPAVKAALEETAVLL
jgi:dTDP-glucose pyrophosphorylase